MADKKSQYINKDRIEIAEVDCPKCGVWKYELAEPCINYPFFVEKYNEDTNCPKCNSAGCHFNEFRPDEPNNQDNEDDEAIVKPNRLLNEKTTYWQLDECIRQELDQVIYYVYNKEPVKFYVADPELNQIVIGYVGKEAEIDEDGHPLKDEKDRTVYHQKLRSSTTLLDAIPLSGIKYNNGLSTDKKYKIKFKTITGETFTTLPNTIEDMISELRGRSLVAKKAVVEEALRGIVISMELKGLIEVTNNIEEPGFYPDPDNENKITYYGLTFKEPTQDDIKECADLINEIVQKYERKDGDGNVVNDRRVFPVTIFKWSIVAPFDWIMKTKYNKWLPWLHLGGWHSTAKNTLAKYALATWRLHNKSVIGFSAANTEARLGYAISQSTMPININEVNNLTDIKYRNLVEMIKNAVDEKNARGKYQKKNFALIPSLGAAILTGNGRPPNDGGYRSKCRSIIFTPLDEIDRNSKEAKEFRDWLNDKIHLLGALGDFTKSYIMNKPEILKDKEWSEIGKEVLTAFYEKAGLPTPAWIDLMVEYNESVHTQDEAIEELRGYFINIINDACNRYRPPQVISEREMKDPLNQDYIKMPLTSRLLACCERSLIPFIQTKEDEDGNTFYITSGIMSDLQKHKLGDLVGSHKGLAALLNFTHKPVRVGGGSEKPQKVIEVKWAEMRKFLEGEIAEITEATEKTDDQEPSQKPSLDETPDPLVEGLKKYLASDESATPYPTTNKKK